MAYPRVGPRVSPAVVLDNPFDSPGGFPCQPLISTRVWQTHGHSWVHAASARALHFLVQIKSRNHPDYAAPFDNTSLLQDRNHALYIPFLSNQCVNTSSAFQRKHYVILLSDYGTWFGSPWFFGLCLQSPSHLLCV